MFINLSKLRVDSLLTNTTVSRVSVVPIYQQINLSKSISQRLKCMVYLPNMKTPEQKLPKITKIL